MNIHKSDGISKKAFKKHNSIEETKVTIEEESDDVVIAKDNDNKGRKISGIRRKGVKIINHVHKSEDKENLNDVTEKESIDKVDSKEKKEFTLKEEGKNSIEKIIFDSEEEKVEIDMNSEFKKEEIENEDIIVFDEQKKEIVEEDESIVFDTESDKNELEENYKSEGEEKLEESKNTSINEEIKKDEDEVKLEKEDQKNPEKESEELRKEKRNEILKNIESFEKTEKNLKHKNNNLSEEISEIIEQQDKTLNKKTDEENVISIDNEKTKDEKILKIDDENDKIEKKNDENLSSEDEEVDTKNIKLEKDEDGLIIKESSELDKVKIDKNKLNSSEQSITNEKRNNVKSTLTTEDNNHSKNLLFVIIGIIILISILVGGFVFYKQSQSKKQVEESKINAKKVEEKNIKDKNIEKDNKIQEENNEIKPEAKVKKLFSDCSYFSNNLSSCTPYSCKFEHPDTHEIMKREVSGIKDGKCEYTETLAEGKKLTCNYEKEPQKLVSEFYDKILVAKFIGQAEINEEKVKGIENPIKKMVEEGICVVEENTETLTGDCPEGQEYRGEYSSDGINLMPICVDLSLVCEACVNCVSDKQKIVIDRMEGVGECKDCSISTDCREGYHCFNNSCVTNEILLNEVSCSDENANCTKLPCKDCSDGSKYCNEGENAWNENLANKCVDCTDTKYCKEGFKCENYKCIAN